MGEFTRTPTAVGLETEYCRLYEIKTFENAIFSIFLN